MHTNVWTTASTAQASAAAHMLRDHRFGCLPSVGILTEADFVRLLTTPPGELAPAEATPRVESVMTAAPITVDVGTTLGDARKTMTRYQVRHLPIVNGDEPLGILSDRDLQVAEAALAHIGGASEVTVGCIGSETPYVVDRDARLDAVLLDMAEQRIGSALVVEGGRLVGILTATDACRLLGAELRALFPSRTFDGSARRFTTRTTS